MQGPAAPRRDCAAVPRLSVVPAAPAQGAEPCVLGGLPGLAAPCRLYRELWQRVRGCPAHVSRAASICGVCAPCLHPSWGSLSWLLTPSCHWGHGQKWGADTPRSHPACSGCTSTCSCTEGCPSPAAGSRVWALSTTPSPVPEPHRPRHVALGLPGRRGGGGKHHPGPIAKPPKSRRGERGASGGRHRALARRRQPLGCKGWEKGRRFLPAARMPW